MRIAEIYQSIQGEGLLTGTPSVFVRTSGCNLRCVYCDTPFASWRPEGDDLAIQQIRSAVLRFQVKHVVLTGGEPMLFSELVPLCTQLQLDGIHITIETAGTLYLSLPCDLMSVSPKLSNSTPPADLAPTWRDRHEVTRHQPSVVRRLIDDYPYQLKFVVAQPADLKEIDQYLDLVPAADPDRVMLMPEGTVPEQLEAIEAWLQPYCETRSYQFCPRRQVEWFGHVRGT